jgi:predicted NAD/FAD-binding protein
MRHFPQSDRPLKIAVVGTGIAGLSAAWLLSRRHEVTVFEADDRVGGHSHTVDAGGVPIDTGFIVYNEVTYPNLTALFAHLDVPTKASDMSFAVSMDGGKLEYAGTNLAGPFRPAQQPCQPALLVDAARPRAFLPSGARRRARSRSFR